MERYQLWEEFIELQNVYIVLSLSPFLFFLFLALTSRVINRLLSGVVTRYVIVLRNLVSIKECCVLSWHSDNDN